MKCLYHIDVCSYVKKFIMVNPLKEIVHSELECSDIIFTKLINTYGISMSQCYITCTVLLYYVTVKVKLFCIEQNIYVLKCT